MAAAYSNSWVQTTPGHPSAVATSPTLHDVLIAALVTDASGDGPGSATGFTSSISQATTADGQSLMVLYKPDATGSEGTINLSNTGSNNCIGLVLAASGCDNTTPLDVAAVVANNNSGTASPWTIDASITPTTNGCLIVAVMGSDVTSSADAVHSFSTTVGTTGAWSVRQDIRSGFMNLAIATAEQATAGAITVRGTGTVGGASAGRALALFALRPAGGGGGGGSAGHRIIGGWGGRVICG